MAPENEDTDEGSSQFDFDIIKTATDGFSEANKLGEGGFGVVYKVSDQEFEILIIESCKYLYQFIYGRVDFPLEKPLLSNDSLELQVKEIRSSRMKSY